MIRSPYRSHLLVLPLVMLTVVLLEEIAEYYLRAHVESQTLRVAGIMLFYGVGFSLAADRITPLMKRLVVKVRSRSRQSAGKVGVWAFFALCYGTLFLAFSKRESQGATWFLME